MVKSMETSVVLERQYLFQGFFRVVNRLKRIYKNDEAAATPKNDKKRVSMMRRAFLPC